MEQWNSIHANRNNCTIAKNTPCSGDYSSNYIIIRSHCPILEKTLTHIPPHYLVRLYVDVYFMGANDFINNFYIHLDDDELFHLQY